MDRITSKREMSFEEMDEADDILDACQRWRNGEIDWHQAMRAGSHKVRGLIHHCLRDDVRYRAFYLHSCTMTANRGMAYTRNGIWVPQAELEKDYGWAKRVSEGTNGW